MSEILGIGFFVGFFCAISIQISFWIYFVMKCETVIEDEAVNQKDEVPPSDIVSIVDIATF